MSSSKAGGDFIPEEENGQSLQTLHNTQTHTQKIQLNDFEKDFYLN